MAVIACGLLVIGGTVAWASGLVDPVWVGSNGTIAACVQNDSGNLRLIDPSSKRQDIDSCRKGETRISFNQKGQQGAPGPQGPQGPAGTLPGPANVTVNCSQGQTIDGALAANAAATSVQITVQGTCTESVGINQDNVTLQAGSAGAGIQAPSANQDVIDINDARHVMVQGLTLTGGNAGINASGGDFQANDLHITDASNGVNAGGEAFGYLTNVSIDGCNDGVNAGAAEIGVTGGSITGCQGFGVIAQDGGSVILNGGATVTAARQDVVAQYGGTVEIGDATISNATNTDVFAFGGSITVAGSGTLILAGAVTGKGVAKIAGGTLDAASSFTQNVTFSGTTCELELGQSQGYTGNVSGFSKSGKTSFDLLDIAFVSASEATFSGTTTRGVLTVTDGMHTAHINLKGNYVGSSWIASSDNHGGVIVVDPKAKPPPAPVHRFIAAMSGLVEIAGAPLAGVGPSIRPAEAMIAPSRPVATA